MSSEVKSIDNIKNLIKLHIALLKNCFICKLSPTYLLYSLNKLDLDDGRGRAFELASVHLI